MLGEEFETFGVAAEAFRKLSVTVFGMQPKDHGRDGGPGTDDGGAIKAVQSSGMVSKIVGRSIIVQAMATVMCGSMEAVLEGKTSDNASQLRVGLVVQNHGNLRTIGAEGCNLVTSNESV